MMSAIRPFVGSRSAGGGAPICNLTLFLAPKIQDAEGESDREVQVQAQERQGKMNVTYFHT
jgi:hypothetical protein